MTPEAWLLLVAFSGLFCFIITLGIMAFNFSINAIGSYRDDGTFDRNCTVILVVTVLVSASGFIGFLGRIIYTAVTT